MHELPNEPPGGAGERERELIKAYGKTIALLRSHEGQVLVGLAWSGSGAVGKESVEFIDVLYRDSTKVEGYPDIVVRTWMERPTVRSEFDTSPYLSSHLRSHLVERSNVLETGLGLKSIVESISVQSDPTVLAADTYVAREYAVSGYVVTVVAPLGLDREWTLGIGLQDIPTLRSSRRPQE